MDVMFWVWLGVLIVTAVVELATMEVVSIWFTFAAILPFILAATKAVGWVWQLVIFVCVSAILIIALREVTKKFLLRNSNEKTNLDALVGKKYRMLSRTDFETVGSVKINDVVWSAIGENQQTIEAGEVVEIVKISGNKMIVKKAGEPAEKIATKAEKTAEKTAKNKKNAQKDSKSLQGEGEEKTTLQEMKIEPVEKTEKPEKPAKKTKKS